MFLTLDNKLSPNDGHVGNFSCTSYPKLVTKRLRVQCKGFGFVVIGGSGFQCFGVTTMPNFSEPEAPDILRIQSLSDPLFMNRIFRVVKSLYGFYVKVVFEKVN